MFKYFRVAALLCSLVACSSVSFADTTDSSEGLLPPERAFWVSHAEISDMYVALIFHVAKGYRLYRDRIEVTTPMAVRRIYSVTKPPGEMEYDRALNKTMETYRGETRVDVSTSTGRPMDLVVTMQGCADVGVCYPPIKQTIHLGARGYMGW